MARTVVPENPAVARSSVVAAMSRCGVWLAEVLLVPLICGTDALSTDS
jgi:hypothetical protein